MVAHEKEILGCVPVGHDRNKEKGSARRLLFAGSRVLLTLQIK